jgi:hypothetical protein
VVRILVLTYSIFALNQIASLLLSPAMCSPVDVAWFWSEAVLQCVTQPRGCYASAKHPLIIIIFHVIIHDLLYSVQHDPLSGLFHNIISAPLESLSGHNVKFDCCMESRCTNILTLVLKIEFKKHDCAQENKSIPSAGVCCRCDSAGHSSACSLCAMAHCPFAAVSGYTRIRESLVFLSV